MNVLTRPITIADLDKLYELSRSTFYESFSPMNTEENMASYMNKAFNKEQLKKEILNTDSEFYFCMVGEVPAGYIKVNYNAAQTEPEKDSMEIERIYVRKEFQGMKLGRVLIERACELAAQRNLKRIWLGVWDQNHNAIQFYSRFGFKAYSSHAFMLGTDLQTDLLMEHHLAG